MLNVAYVTNMTLMIFYEIVISSKKQASCWKEFDICSLNFFCKLFRELIKVIQRNFRQFLKLRNWGWFSLIQKTRPLVGMVDIEVVIQELESAANEAVADVQNEINEKRRLEDENKKLQVSPFWVLFILKLY